MSYVSEAWGFRDMRAAERFLTEQYATMYRADDGELLLDTKTTWVRFARVLRHVVLDAL